MNTVAKLREKEIAMEDFGEGREIDDPEMEDWELDDLVYLAENSPEYYLEKKRKFAALAVVGVPDSEFVLHITAFMAAAIDDPEIVRKIPRDVFTHEDYKISKDYRKDYNFLKPEDPRHVYYLHRVTEYKTLFLDPIPGVHPNLMHLRPDLVFHVDLTALDVALEGPQREAMIVADFALMGDGSKRFFHTDDEWNPFYQHRLADYKAQVEAGNLSRLRASTPQNLIPDTNTVYKTENELLALGISDKVIRSVQVFKV